jgi:hypothetical protein
VDRVTDLDFAGDLLLPVDPVRGLQIIRGELVRLIELDPKVREAAARVEQHLLNVSSTEDGDQRLAPVLWAQVRDHFRAASGVAAIRRALGDGDLILRWTESLLATRLHADVVRQVIEEAKQLEASDSGSGSRSFLDARDELQRQARIDAGADFIEVELMVGLALAAAAAAAIAAAAHTASHYTPEEIAAVKASYT